MAITTFKFKTVCGKRRTLHCGINPDDRTSVSVRRELQDISRQTFGDDLAIAEFEYFAKTTA